MARFFDGITRVKWLPSLAISKIFTPKYCSQHAQHLGFAHQDVSAAGGKVLGKSLGGLRLGGINLYRGRQSIQRIPALVELLDQFLGRGCLHNRRRLGNGKMALGGDEVGASGKQERKSQRRQRRRDERRASSFTRLLLRLAIAGHVAVVLVQRCGEQRMSLRVGSRRLQSRDSWSSADPWPRATTGCRDCTPGPAASPACRYVL